MKKMAWMSLVVLFAAFSELISYPISPRTLRRLCLESRIIVLGEVLSVGETANYDSVNSIYTRKLNEGNMDDIPSDLERILFFDTKAELKVVDVLKGEYTHDKIDIYFQPNMICPSPAVYDSGELVISFLDTLRSPQGFYTVGSSYGKKSLNREELNIYAQRIREFSKIVGIAEAEKRRSETVEWLVRLTENPVTRWEGSYEFGRYLFPSSYYDRSEDPEFYKDLDESQKERLLSPLYSSNSIQYNDLGLVHLALVLKDRRIIPHVIHYLESIDYEIPMGYENLLPVIADLAGDSILISLASEQEDYQVGDLISELSEISEDTSFANLARELEKAHSAMIDKQPRPQKEIVQDFIQRWRSITE